MEINAIVLASGFSKRFGKTNKLLSCIDAKPCLEWIFDTLKKVNFSNIFVVSNDDDIEQLALKNEVTYINCKNPEEGRSASIKTFINVSDKVCKPDSAFMFFVADQPFISEKTINSMIDAFKLNKDKVVMSKLGEKSGNPVIFPSRLKEKLLTLTGDNGGKAILEGEKDIVFCSFFDEIEHFDIDYYEDYKKLLLLKSNTIIVRSGGDIATGVIQKLFNAGFYVAVLETQLPMAIRRSVALCEAVYDRYKVVENIEAVLVSDTNEIRSCFLKGQVPVIIDPLCAFVDKIGAFALVDAIIAKKNLGTNMRMAPITIGLGPGFYASKDVTAVIETMRGHNLGKIIEHGSAMENTGIPGEIGGESSMRVVYSKNSGTITILKKIGEIVSKGKTIALIDDIPVEATISGVLRGIIKDGFLVKEGFKIADIDPREQESNNCTTISDKARAIGGGVLEAILKIRRGLNEHI